MQGVCWFKSFCWIVWSFRECSVVRWFWWFGGVVGWSGGSGWVGGRGWVGWLVIQDQIS